jgi:phosphatidylethanolamine/phosphatidyl-N-methylethanolamine N-methyltransferase
MVCPDLQLIERKSLRPWGIFTMMRFRKDAEVVEHPVAAE